MNASCWRLLFLTALAAAPPAPGGARPPGGSQTPREAEQLNAPPRTVDANAVSSDAKEGDHAAAVIALRETKPTTVVYTEYAGPYWGIGPVLSRVRSDMASAGQRGPTFVRYPSDPRGRSLAPNATRVGYFAEAGVKPGGGYAVEHWGAEQVVTTTVLGPNAGATALYPLMREWATAHGYTVFGPIVEVYYPSAPGARVEDQQTDIRMPVRPDVAPSVSSEDEGLAGTHGGASSGVPVATRVPPAASAAAGSARLAAPAAMDPGTSGDATPVGADAGRRVEAGTTAVERPALEAGAAIADSGFAQLVHAGAYNRAMAILLPADHALSAVDADWLNEINDRIHAVAEGLVQTGITSEDVSALAAALGDALSRCAVAAGGSAGTVATTARTTDSQRDRQAVVQDLNRLMARISLRSVDGPACTSNLREIMIRVHAVMVLNDAEK